MATLNGGVSFWYSQIGLPIPRQPLPGDRDADVCIVGAGLTGLWSAYYLQQHRPDLRIVLVEKEFAGFGASGRNGGWLSGELAGSRERYAASRGREGVVRLLGEMRAAVDVVIQACDAEGIEADIVKDGVLMVARNPAQRARLLAEIEHERSWGATDDDVRLVERDELDTMVRIDGALGASYSPHCARVQPAKLVRGLAEVVERRGAVIYEQTTAHAIGDGCVITDRGTVTAPIVLRCLEGYSASISGARRDWLPMNSSMIVTDPVPDVVADELHWRGAQLIGDEAHGYCYAQRTADGRIALGGRGVPYRFGSRTDTNGRTQQWTVRQLTTILHDMFPAMHQVPIAQSWCGVLGVPRDWCTTVNFDRSTGVGVAGGYVGSGLTTTNLAARTLVDLALDRDTELTTLPWVGRAVRRWEPEPLRWLGVQSMYALYRSADRMETASGEPKDSWLARIGNTITGR